MPLLTVGAGRALINAPPYNPEADAGLVLWYRADDITAGNGPRDAGANIPTNGEDVFSWADAGPNNDTLGTFGGGTGITYVTNSLNGMPGVQADAAGNSGMRSLENVYALASTTLSVLVLMKNLTGGDANGRILSLVGEGALGDDNNTKSFCLYQAGTTVEEASTFSNSANIGKSTRSAFSFGTARVLGLVFDGTLAHRYISGVEDGAGTAFTAELGDNLIQRLFLFSNIAAAQNGEAIIYEVILTRSDLSKRMSAVNAYFDSRWGTH